MIKPLVVLYAAGTSDTVDVLARSLSGFSTEVVRKHEELLRRALRQPKPIAIVVEDGVAGYRRPGEDGITLCSRLMQNDDTKEIRVVVLEHDPNGPSNSRGMTRAQAANDAGAYRTFSYPFDSQKIGRALLTAIGQA